MSDREALNKTIAWLRHKISLAETGLAEATDRGASDIELWLLRQGLSALKNEKVSYIVDKMALRLPFDYEEEGKDDE